MLKHLEDTNPSRIWLREKFQTSLRLVSGDTIVIRFHLTECIPGGFRWDAEKVVAHFDPSILADKETEYGEYLSIVATIAGVLNEKMMLEAEEVMSQVKMSFAILDALKVSDRDGAYLLTASLGVKLLAYDPRASTVWSNWLEFIFRYLGSDNMPEYGLDVVV